MSAALTVAVAGLLVAIGDVGGYAYGIDQGKALQKGHNDATALQAVTEQITAHSDLVKQSATASRSLRLAARQGLMNPLPRSWAMRSLQLLTAVLAASFPAGVMRGLEAARERAAQAAFLERGCRCAARRAPPAPPGSGEVDPVAVALKDMYDLYGTCAGRLVDLLNWMDGGPR